ncbi:GAF domain-containing protein [Microvirga aerilata]|uniref:histidine kinase n=1 Tax=Microvirga aerilata TaxID=670292 RepID=A0A936ZD42_9HYPH|nr:GAF domain-containing protein [Microvirga aerilata]MBL0405640.1 GAF domain-containing protein [Microvirga aerilata]
MPDLEQMVKRQKALADFGDFALRNEDLDQILTEACRLVGDALGTDLAKVLEIEQNGQCLFMRAGIGWKPGLVGKLRLPMNERSSETYSIKAGKPVVTQDISKEDRFEFPDFLKEHGAVAIVNVPIFLPGGKPYGLLQVDSRKPREFGEEDIAFLRTYATILGPVIDRLHKSHSLKDALEANQHLLKELQHRVKNHISIITSLVRLRAKDVSSEEARRELTTVGERIEVLRLVNELLYVAGTTDLLRLRPYVMQLVESLCHLDEGQFGKVRLDFAIEEVDLGPEIAVPLGLILNEFVTNSLKYAFDGQGGVISVSIEVLEENGIRVRMSDNGKGLTAEPRPARPGSGTGMKLIEAFARQLDAKLDWSSSQGTALSLEFSRH